MIVQPRDMIMDFYYRNQLNKVHNPNLFVCCVVRCMSGESYLIRVAASERGAGELGGHGGRGPLPG